MGKFAFDPPEVNEHGVHHIRFSDDRVEGRVAVLPHKTKTNINIEYMGARPKKSNSGKDVPNIIGPSAVRQVVSHIKKSFPSANTASFERVSGARFPDDSFQEHPHCGEFIIKKL